jgi:putative membrane-bound dehydrogenase-like protein
MPNFKSVVLCAMAMAAGSISRAGAPDLAQLVLAPGLEATLVAAEPDVIDPVAMVFDDQGRLFVVEMRDYPEGIGPERKAGGTVRLLEDTDGDGRYEKVSLFAEGLSFPTSIACWKGGVIVAAPPLIVYLKDTNGDGKADTRQTLFDGFTLGVTDSNVNGLRWGMDGRLHGLNGGNGGAVRSMLKPDAAVKIGNADFAFDPASGELARTFQTSGGFGLAFDEWGRSFCTYNINHIQQRVLPLRYLERNALLPPREATVSISDHGEMARIYPASSAETRVNHPEQAGYFSSAGGVGFIGSPAFGEYFGSVLVGDVVGNLIHRDVLKWDGPVAVARRAESEQTSEFLASRDPAFRPTAMEIGPDGALYLADMQRDVIEHPDYIPEKVKRKINVRAGDDRGRIYRITPKGGLPRAQPDLRRTSTYQLTRALGHSNQWQRATAQRVLLERGDAFAVGFLETQMKIGNPAARFHSLWSLQALGAMSERLLSESMTDAHPAIREAATLLIERWPTNTPALWEKVVRATKDDEARVRFQAALSLGALNDPKQNGVLGEFYVANFNDSFMRLAALSSVRSGAIELLAKLVLQGELTRDWNDNRAAALRELADLAGAEAGRKQRVDDLAGIIEAAKNDSAMAAALEGLQSGLQRAGSPGKAGGRLLAALANLQSPELTLAGLRLSRTAGLPDSKRQSEALAGAAASLTNRAANLKARVAAAELLSFGEAKTSAPILLQMFSSAEPAPLQEAALQALRTFPGAEFAPGLLARWREMAPSLRPVALNFLLSRRECHDALLTAIESQQIALGELNLDLEQRRALLRKGSEATRARAAKLMGDEEYSNRKAVVETWLAKLPERGDASAGRAVFEKLCAQCHFLAGIGHHVGPDLASIAHRSVEDLLSNILDPNMAINPAYINWQATLENGDSENGILAGESNQSVTLLQAAGRKVVLERAKIKTLKSSGTSLMPEGLEAGLSAEDLRNLIAFLQEKR